MPLPSNYDDPTDAALARLVRDVTPPTRLRRELLLLAPRSPRPILAFWLTALAPLAAVVVIWFSMESRQPSLEKAQADLLAFLNTDFELSTEPKPIDQLRTWLDARGAPADFEIPKELAAHLPEGCRVIEWQGHTASLICFYIEGGPTVHLVVFNAGTFRQMSSSPQIASNGAWAVVMWKAGNSDFLLFGETDSKNLLRLL